eukprot:CFRG8578T1
MPVRIRMARFGRIQEPVYRLVVADSRSKRDGKFIEHVGTFEPLPTKEGEKHTMLNTERIKYWISVGAQPTKPVARLLAQSGLIPPPPGHEARRLMREKLRENPEGRTPAEIWFQELPENEKAKHIAQLNKVIDEVERNRAPKNLNYHKCIRCGENGHLGTECTTYKEENH